MRISDIDALCLLVDKNILIKNINEMAQIAIRAGVNLRSHIKAHKCSKIAQLQLETGAKGVTVAKLDETAVMFDAFFQAF